SRTPATPPTSPGGRPRLFRASTQHLRSKIVHFEHVGCRRRATFGERRSSRRSLSSTASQEAGDLQIVGVEFLRLFGLGGDERGARLGGRGGGRHRGR